MQQTWCVKETSNRSPKAVGFERTEHYLHPECVIEFAELEHGFQFRAVSHLVYRGSWQSDGFNLEIVKDMQTVPALSLCALCGVSIDEPACAPSRNGYGT